jgi:hypothetical protein
VVTAANVCNAVVTAKCFENAESLEPRAVDLPRHTCERHGAVERGSGSDGPSVGASFARNASMAAMPEHQRSGLDRNSYTDTIKHIVLFRGGRHRRMLESGRHRRML